MKIAFAITALLAVSASSADNFQAPFVKDGLWQANTSLTSAGKTTQVSVKICQNHETQQKDQDLSASLRKRFQCTLQVSHPSTGVFIAVNRCAAGPSPGSVTKTTETLQGDTAYRVEQRRTVGSQESVTIIEGKYLGSCPSDMKPGDTVLPDGRKMNVNEP
jgi:hypothetical protein